MILCDLLLVTFFGQINGLLASVRYIWWAHICVQYVCVMAPKVVDNVFVLCSWSNIKLLEKGIYRRLANCRVCKYKPNI